ncbi:MAG: hypothetical protein KKC79_11220 [Gammaproteobacteria bacterium]|nr:hypothetical protein [Gammaproteobacteria bacterium]MBU1441789.1 hypothetical protein [Gammaproteobacteria bacterium]MBU2288026.1 hypothetical protein [Gammaproteobacteria bacterium]MBU2409200.1 hypothetical protein [Gammaproteobacteria bacterium]
MSSNDMEDIEMSDSPIARRSLRAITWARSACDLRHETILIARGAHA